MQRSGGCFSYPEAGCPSIAGQLKKYNLFLGFQQVTKVGIIFISDTTGTTYFREEANGPETTPKITRPSQAENPLFALFNAG